MKKPDPWKTRRNQRKEEKKRQEGREEKNRFCFCLFSSWSDAQLTFYLQCMDMCWLILIELDSDKEQDIHKSCNMTLQYWLYAILVL